MGGTIVKTKPKDTKKIGQTYHSLFRTKRVLTCLRILFEMISSEGMQGENYKISLSLLFEIVPEPFVEEASRYVIETGKEENVRTSLQTMCAWPFTEHTSKWIVAMLSLLRENKETFFSETANLFLLTACLQMYVAPLREGSLRILQLLLYQRPQADWFLSVVEWMPM